MYLVSFTSPDKSTWFKDSCINNLSLKFILFLVSKENMVAIVINPRPPVWIKVIITNWPNSLQYVPVSTTTNPVTHTAEVEVNRAFKNPILSPFWVEIGKFNIIAPNNINIPNPITITLAGSIEWIFENIFLDMDFTFLYPLLYICNKFLAIPYYKIIVAQ